jgi:hypothetical protein
MHMNELIDSSNVCDECMHAMRGIQLRAAVGMHAMRGKQLRAAVDMRARGGWQRRMCACDIDRGEVVVEKVLPSLAGCHARVEAQAKSLAGVRGCCMYGLDVEEYDVAHADARRRLPHGGGLESARAGDSYPPIVCEPGMRASRPSCPLRSPSAVQQVQ